MTFSRCGRDTNTGERRLGELIKAQKEAGLMNQGVRLNGTTEGRSSALVNDAGRENPTLSDMGVSYDLSSRSQELAATGGRVRVGSGGKRHHNLFMRAGLGVVGVEPALKDATGKIDAAP